MTSNLSKKVAGVLSASCEELEECDKCSRLVPSRFVYYFDDERYCVECDAIEFDYLNEAVGSAYFKRFKLWIDRTYGE